ncbi:MAG: hypothetical protein IPM68_03815 [Flavobacteriales bacterium]|nr:hypothetical protein [Flavobacteriales bacterium]
MVAPDGDLLIAGHTLDHVFPAINGIVAHAGVWDLYYGRFEHAPGDPLNDAKRVFMTYYGGTGSDKPIVAHYASNDVLWIGGWTNSENAPIKPFADPADGSYWQGALKGDSDGLLLLVDPVQGNVLRSTYLGGEGDEMLTAVTEDVFGDLHWGAPPAHQPARPAAPARRWPPAFRCVIRAERCTTRARTAAARTFFW